MLKSKHILIVDDSVTYRTFLRNLLKASGGIVEEASDGQSGLKLLSDKKNYDLIILDLMLPDIDGIQILREVRQNNSETAIVMLTGMGGVKSAISAMREGADNYVEKNDLVVDGDTTGLIYAIEKALELRAGIVAKQQLETIKADFYSMVTHDLRSPTAATLMAVRMMMEGEFGALSLEQRETLSIIEYSTERTLELINNYLDFAKIDAGYLHLERFDVELRPLVEQSIRLARLQTQAQKQTLIVDLPAEAVIAHVDAERLKQVFDNLISNALKYTPSGGTITVQLYADTNNQQIVFKVSDTGRGISAAQLSSLFTKYHRVPGEATRGISGTGLGLLIVKEVVEAHGGTVEVESKGKAGEGSTFTVKIPFRISIQSN